MYSHHLVELDSELGEARESARRGASTDREDETLAGSLGNRWTELHRATEQASDALYVVPSVRKRNLLGWHSLLLHCGLPRPRTNSAG